MPVELIDAHHHLWKYSAEDYPWMLEGMDAIRRDFLLEDLQKVLREGDIAGAVTVQARQTLFETKWLLDLASIGLASMKEIIRGVVGWVPLVDPKLDRELEHAVVCEQ